MKNLSNLFSNEHWFALKFTFATGEYGRMYIVNDIFGGLLLCVALKRFENLGLEFNRENALEFIKEQAEGYVKYDIFREHIDSIYRTVSLNLICPNMNMNLIPDNKYIS